MGKPTLRPERRRRSPNPRFLLAVASLVLLVLVGSAAWVKANQKTVEISVDGSQITLKTLKKTVEQALAEAGVSLGPADEVRPGLEAALARQQKVIIIRAVPVAILVDGKTSEILTTRATVSDVLAACDVTLGDSDRVEPDLATAIESGMTIAITRVREDITVSAARIPYAVQKREDASLEIGITKVLQQGQEGEKQLKYRNVYENGKKVKSALIETKVVKEPVTNIIAYGTAGTISRGAETIRFRKAYDMVATAYTSGPESTGKWSNGLTSIGMKATFGVVAVDPRVIPLRSRLYVDGYGFAIAGDIGSAIKGQRIDLCYDTVGEALKWGRRKTKVYLLD